MFHIVHVIHIDGDRAVAAFKFLVFLGLAWLAWEYLPTSDTVEAWLHGTWNAVVTPFMWVADGVGAVFSATAMLARGAWSALVFVLTWQAVLLPVAALLAGWILGTSQGQVGYTFWLGAAGFSALCTALMGAPLLAAMTLAGSVAALWVVLWDSGRLDWTGWLAAVAAAVLSALGSWRYGAALQPDSWVLIPASWCCLALGAAFGTPRRFAWHEVRSSSRSRVLLAVVLAFATAGPLIVIPLTTLVVREVSPPQPPISIARAFPEATTAVIAPMTSSQVLAPASRDEGGERAGGSSHRPGQPRAAGSNPRNRSGAHAP